MKVYLDNAATTPILPHVIEAMTEVMNHTYGNPSSIHAEGRKAKNLLEQCRKRIASLIGASPSEITFTSGGTEANNMALKCAVRDLHIKRIITTPIEHHCVMHSIESIQKLYGIQVELLNVAADGSIRIEDLEEHLRSSSDKTLVSLMFANNEIGTILPLEEVAQVCADHQAYLHTDTVQAIGHYPFNVSALKVDFISGSAHKFHGPKGVGFLYTSGDIQIAPLIDGGAQERNMRGGTENIVGIVGMTEALSYAYEHLEKHRSYILQLKQYLRDKLQDSIPRIEFNGPEDGLYTVLSVSFPNDTASSMFQMQLDMKGICLSAGSACSSGSSGPSHVIQAIRPDSEYVTVRFSFSHLIDKSQLDYVIETIQNVLLAPAHH